MKLPFAAFLAGAFAASTSKTMLVSAQNIPETAEDLGSFGTLVAALGAADLLDTLAAEGRFTVFAPTDQAFRELPDDLVECLLKPKNKDALTDILLYHVVKGKFLSRALSDGMEVPTLLPGKDVEVTIGGNGLVLINDSLVVTPDVEASNGVIHAIDSVLVPSSIDVGEFLATCRREPSTPVSKKCRYMGQSRSPGQWLEGPTHTCKCSSSHGRWVDCYSNSQHSVTTKYCYYGGKSTRMGEWLRGPTHTCKCNSSGHWVDCRRNYIR